MSIFNRKQQTEAKARAGVAWPFRLLALMTILMGMWLASPQVEAAEPTYPIQKLEDGSLVVEGTIFVKAEAEFKVPEVFAGYKWQEIKRINLSPKRSTPTRSSPAQQAILYQIIPDSNTSLPSTLAEYNELTAKLKGLQGKNSQVSCASPDYVIGSPNTGAGAFSAGSAVELPSVNDVDFEGQPAFNQFQPFRSPDNGLKVDVAVFDAFRGDAYKYWPVNEVDFDAITVTPIDLVPGPDLDLELPNMPEHGEMIISQIRYLAPAATILPVHVLHDNLLGETTTLIEGLKLVIERKDNNPDRKMVVNMSLGLTASQDLKKRCDIQTMNGLLRTARDKGIVVVAASGNDADDGNPGDSRPEPQYPANVPTVIGVAASNSAGLPTSYSNNGDVMAPGGDISGFCSENPNPTESCAKQYGVIGRIPISESEFEYIAWEGTSFAAPLVSGLAANLLSCNPDLRVDEVREFIDAELIPNPNPNLNVDRNNPINVQNALAAAGCIPDLSPPPLDVRLLCDVSSAFCDAIVSGGSGGYQFSWQGNGGATIINGSGSRATIDPGRCPGNPSVMVEVTDSSGNSDTEQISLQCNRGGIGISPPIP